MNMHPLLFVLALATVDLDIVTVPLSSEIRVALIPAARSEIKREETPYQHFG